MLYFPLISTNMYSVTYRVLIILPSAVYLACKNKCQFNPVTGSLCFFLTCNIRRQTPLLFGGLSKQLFVLSCSVILGSVHDRGITQIVCLLIFPHLVRNVFPFFPDLLQALTLIVAPFRLLNVF